MDDITATLKHWFTPHHSNNHRPRILHPEMLVAVIAVLFVLHMGMRVTAKSYPSILGYATNITIDDLLLYTNQERLENGLVSLQLNGELSKAAEKKALDMFEDDYWAHTAPDGTTPWDFIVSEGYTYTYAGENLARDFSDSKGVVNAWMNSPSHRDNIMRDKYEEIGFAVVNGSLDGSETTLVVQVFGTPRVKTPAITSVAETKTVAQAYVPSPAISPVQSANTEQIVQTARSVQKPVFDRSFMQNGIAYMLLGGLLGILIVDSILIWRRRTIRVAGHNFAHVIFIVSLLGIAIISTRGSIL